MMNIKLIGVIMVGFSFCIVGFRSAAHVKKEVSGLQDLLVILDHMECELNYHLTPLPDLCRHIAQVGKSLSSVFEQLSEELSAQVLPDVSMCMDVVISKSKEIPPVVRELLTEFGCSLGRYDLRGQLTSLESVRQKCASLLAKLEKDRNERVRCYRTIGLCVGILISILLL